jgi:hypothetical protein
MAQKKRTLTKRPQDVSSSTLLSFDSEENLKGGTFFQITVVGARFSRGDVLAEIKVRQATLSQIIASEDGTVLAYLMENGHVPAAGDAVLSVAYCRHPVAVSAFLRVALLVHFPPSSCLKLHT